MLTSVIVWTLIFRLSERLPRVFVSKVVLIPKDELHWWMR